MIPFSLTKRTRQVRESGGTDSLRERGRARRVRKVAENSSNGATVGARTSGRLVYLPCGFRNGSAWHCRQESGTGVGDVGRDGRADAINTALFAGVRGGVILDLTEVGPAADISAGAVTGFQLSRAAGRQLLMGVRDESGGDGGSASAICCGSPMEHAVGVELVYSCADARRWGGGGCS